MSRGMYEGCAVLDDYAYKGKEIRMRPIEEVRGIDEQRKILEGSDEKGVVDRLVDFYLRRRDVYLEKGGVE